jgi:hypothetical protein
VSSNNYAVYGPRFSLEEAFRVLRMKSLPSGNFYYDEIAECGVVTSASELKSLIGTAHSLQFVDFGNGLTGLHAECDGFMFCAVPEFKESGMKVPERGTHSESFDPEEIF